MKIYDISQEVFSCKVFSGDPAPERQVMLRIPDGAVCNLTAFRMCAHNGTHVDAPFHFLNDGRTIDRVDLARFVGYAFVTKHEGEISAEDARKILAKAREADGEAAKRILVKGPAVVVHLKMLGAEIVLLEGIRLGGVAEGVYFLNAAPLNLGGSDGAPCRAILVNLSDD